MKRIKIFLAGILAVAFVSASGWLAPVVAFAEGTENEPTTNESVLDEEVIEKEEIIENTPNDEVVEGSELTFNDILNFVGEFEKEQGFEDEWDKALYYVKNAASAKKVEIMTVLNSLMLGVFSVDRFIKIIQWYRKTKNDTTSKDIKDIKTANGQQTNAINDLIDEVEGEKVAVAESIAREKALAEGIEKQNIAIRALIRGTNIKQDLKDEAFRALNDSDDKCDEAKK